MTREMWHFQRSEIVAISTAKHHFQLHCNVIMRKSLHKMLIKTFLNTQNKIVEREQKKLDSIAIQLCNPLLKIYAVLKSLVKIFVLVCGGKQFNNLEIKKLEKFFLNHGCHFFGAKYFLF